MKHRSPWIYQLDHERALTILKEDVKTDVAIVGAGIAGISTAFFLLRETDKTVVIVEKGKMAHGATGHNAGQIASYFERPFYELVDEFGLEKAVDAQRSIESAWGLLDLMYEEGGLNIPVSRFLGHAGFSTYDQIIRHLKDNECRRRGGLRIEEMRIADTAPFVKDIPSEFAGLYEIVPHATVLGMLQTEDKEYLAVLSYQKGCLNSALFCQELVTYMTKKYAGRFALYEHAPITRISMHEESSVLDAGRHTITAGRVVLCTNGFEGFSIFNKGGLAINTKFHHLVRGMVGYMSAYIEPLNKPPVAVSYFPTENTNAASDPFAEDPYFYLTRRPFEFEGLSQSNLISVGGPEFSLEDRGMYDSELDFPEEAKDRISRFVKTTYDPDPNKKIDYQFTWHGLMGYTPSGVRVVGEEPKNKDLLYNLGCNGVGILPSIYGAKRIADLISGMKLPPSIFDPR
jgi:glycine/D-amino acid oxidase-like deaminating enzyme